jgi:Putative F0F1-ATPase subunit Ca2+/Mg2+ transporter
MKEFAPVLSAGGTFAITSLAGLTLGIWMAAKTGQGWWTFIGLMAGLAAGAYGAFRLLQRSL